jgi:hypothetical protein
MHRLLQSKLARIWQLCHSALPIAIDLQVVDAVSDIKSGHAAGFKKVPGPGIEQLDSSSRRFKLYTGKQCPALIKERDI